MITFKCEKPSCSNLNVEYNFLGNPSSVECGGCKDVLTGYNQQPDPEIPAEIEE
jgi:hypothetical protein